MATARPREGRGGKGGAGRDEGGERLQKVLAARGVASRRAAEELILDGRVTVNGRVVVELGTRVDAANDIIKVGGRTLGRPRPTYLLLNKPRGYITTASDPEGRRTIFDLVDARERVFPVGRLDMDSEGLLLLTNDGELANRIAHPRHRIDKEYHALVEGSPSGGALERLRRGGLLVEGGRTSPADLSTIGAEAGGTWVRVVIHEGRKRQVRRMFEEIGHPVRRLRRVRLGQLTLAGLAPAESRPLTEPELVRLRRLVGLAPDADGAAPARQPGQPAQPARPRPDRAPTRSLGAGRPRSSQGRPSGDDRTKGRAKPTQGGGERDRSPSGGRGGGGRSNRGAPGKGHAGGRTRP